MQKKDLLEDIQKKIDLCDQHLNQNPYPPAQKRVGYILKNKCKAIDIPLYLNAIYNEEQLKLNTNITERQKYTYTAPIEQFTLADVDNLDVNLYLTDTIVTTKQKKYSKYKKSFLNLGEKTGLGTKEEYWIDLISSSTRVTDNQGNFIYNDEQLWKEVTNNNIDIKTTSLQEALRQYNARKNKKLNNYYTYEPGDKENQRYCSYHTYKFGGYIDITDFTLNKIENCIKNETEKNTKYKEINNQLFTWELLNWEVFVDDKSISYYFIDYENQEENNQLEGYVNSNTDTSNWKNTTICIKTTDILDKMNKTKSNTSEMDKLLDENDDIYGLINDFENEYFNPYWEEYTNFRKNYSWDGEVSKKEVNNFNKVKKLVDKMFKVVLKYKNKASLNESLAGFIQKYEKHSKNYSVNQDRPTITNFNDSSTAKKMQQLMKQKQQILDSGNASLQEYYHKQEINYQLEKEKHVQQMLKNAEQISKKESQFISLIDPENLRYNGLQTAFIQHLNLILEKNGKRIKELDDQYKQNLFKDSDIKIKIVIKFIPDCIPEYFYAQTLDSSFIYEDLQNKIKEIVEDQNKKKQNEAYYNTKGKLQQQERQEELAQIKKKKEELIAENTKIDQILPLIQEGLKQLEYIEKQDLGSLVSDGNPYQKQIDVINNRLERFQNILTLYKNSIDTADLLLKDVDMSERTYNLLLERATPEKAEEYKEKLAQIPQERQDYLKQKEEAIEKYQQAQKQILQLETPQKERLNEILNSPKQIYFLEKSKQYGDKRDLLQIEFDSFSNQKIANEQQLGALTQRQSTLINQCMNFNDHLTPQIQSKESEYEIYNTKFSLQQQLDIINYKLQMVENVKTNQAIINQSIMTTNQKYIQTKNKCAPYFEYINDLNILKKQGGTTEQITQLEDKLRSWTLTNGSTLAQLQQYEKDLENQKNEYLKNLDIINSPQNKEYKISQQQIIKQLEEINQKIIELESPQVSQKIEETEQGTKYEKGYNFSTTGLYKNLYIDTQKENEWLILRQQLKKLYTYYNTSLPSGEIKDPATTKEELKQSFPIETPAGGIEIFEDNNEDCKCNWFIPMDYEIFGPGLALPIKLTTKVYNTDKQGQKIPVYNQKGQFVEFQTERRQMAVQNGYGFIDTGQRITLYYTGLPGPEPISVFISGVGLEYGTLLAGGYIAVTPFNIYQLKKYPYQNTNSNGRFYWLQTGSLKDTYQVFTGKYPIEVTFKIYKKFPLNCGYPKKCGIMTNEEYTLRGKCGLRQFFENTHDIFTQYDENSFDISKFMNIVENGGSFDGELLSEVKDAAIEGAKGMMGDAVKKASSTLLSNVSDLTRFGDDKFEKVYDLYRKNTGEIGGRAAQLMQTKRNIAEWGNTSLSLAQNTWNIDDAIADVDVTKKNMEVTAQKTINMMKGDLIDLIPPECQDVICQTMREVKQDSIKDLGMSVNENTNITIETLTNFVEKSVSNTYEDLKDKASKITDGIQNVGDALTGAVKNFFTQFDWLSLTQYCPRRLSDVTKDLNPLKQQPQQLPDGTWDVPENPSIFSQLGGIIGQEIIGNVMEALNSCITRSITTNNINYSSLFPENTRKYLEAANSIGDIANMAREIGGYNMSLENLFHEANRSSILANFADIDTGNISLGYLYDFLDERGISNIIDVDKTLNVNQTIDSLKNTISKAVSNNNDIIKKLNNGEILSMNDQYKQLVGQNLTNKTLEWAKKQSDLVNTVTSVGQSVKGLVNTDFSKAWKDPHIVTNKLQNITNTMKNMMIKERARRKKVNDQLTQAFSESDEIREMRNYIIQRWTYLNKLTKQYQKQKEQAENLSINA